MTPTTTPNVYTLVRARNAEKYIKKCVKSIFKQSYSKTHVLISLDAPEDDTPNIVKTLWPAMVCLFKERLGVARNMWCGINAIDVTFQPAPNDIIAIVDGDDWLEPNAYHTVVKAYNKNSSLLVTYGSYIKQSKGRKTKISQPYPADAIVRKHPWRGSHLKTFRFKLWRHVPCNYFKDKDGNWLMGASDLALMFCLMELAGLDRCKHISKPIYHWRDNTPHKTNRKAQIHGDAAVRAKRALGRLP